MKNNPWQKSITEKILKKKKTAENFVRQTVICKFHQKYTL